MNNIAIVIMWIFVIAFVLPASIALIAFIWSGVLRFIKYLLKEGR